MVAVASKLSGWLTCSTIFGGVEQQFSQKRESGVLIQAEEVQT